jgi:hypothetical protein
LVCRGSDGKGRVVLLYHGMIFCQPCQYIYKCKGGKMLFGYLTAGQPTTRLMTQLCKIQIQTHTHSHTRTHTQAHTSQFPQEPPPLVSSSSLGMSSRKRRRAEVCCHTAIPLLLHCCCTIVTLLQETACRGMRTRGVYQCKAVFVCA